VNLVCTPEFIEDLAVGYLYSQGLFNTVEQINDIKISNDNSINVSIDGFVEKKLNQTIMTSGERSFETEDNSYEVLKCDVSLEKLMPDQIYKLCDKLFEVSTLHAETGGVHNAALSSFEDNFYEFRKDIGRHNAVDKLIGYCLINDISLNNKILVFSGRISSEIIKKIAKARIPMIISVSAPTDLAIEIAKKLRITLIGFVRGRKMNIYEDCGRVDVKL